MKSVVRQNRRHTNACALVLPVILLAQAFPSASAAGLFSGQLEGQTEELPDISVLVESAAGRISERTAGDSDLREAGLDALREGLEAVTERAEEQLGGYAAARDELEKQRQDAEDRTEGYRSTGNLTESLRTFEDRIALWREEREARWDLLTSGREEREAHWDLLTSGQMGTAELAVEIRDLGKERLERLRELLDGIELSPDARTEEREQRMEAIEELMDSLKERIYNEGDHWEEDLQTLEDAVRKLREDGLISESLLQKMLNEISKIREIKEEFEQIRAERSASRQKTTVTTVTFETGAQAAAGNADAEEVPSVTPRPYMRAETIEPEEEPEVEELEDEPVPLAFPAPEPVVKARPWYRSVDALGGAILVVFCAGVTVFLTYRLRKKRNTQSAAAVG